MRVVLTYSVGRLLGLAEALYEEGYEVEHTPLIETRPVATEGLEQQAKALLTCPWMVFSSQATLEAWQSLHLPLPDSRQKPQPSLRIWVLKLVWLLNHKMPWVCSTALPLIQRPVARSPYHKVLRRCLPCQRSYGTWAMRL